MISAKVQGLNVVLSGMKEFGVRAKAGAFTGVIEALKIADEASQKLISAQDHSLEELRIMGHPYSEADPNPPHDDPVIHVQTGDYLNALTVTPPRGFAGSIIEGKVSIEGDEKIKKLDGWLQEGTLRMIARPWMEHVVKVFGEEMTAVIKARILAGISRDVA